LIENKKRRLFAPAVGFPLMRFERTICGRFSEAGQLRFATDVSPVGMSNTKIRCRLLKRRTEVGIVVGNSERCAYLKRHLHAGIGVVTQAGHGARLQRP
jgi:hypothetical protein